MRSTRRRTFRQTLPVLGILSALVLASHCTKPSNTPLPQAAAPVPTQEPLGSAGQALSAPAPDSGSPAMAPCRAQRFHYPQVAAACRQGGKSAAKRWMKQATKRAKAAGTRLSCTSCHTSLKSYALTPNAIGDLKPWL